MDWYIIYTAERDTGQTLKQLHNITNNDIPIQTIQKWLYEVGIQNGKQNNNLC